MTTEHDMRAAIADHRAGRLPQAEAGYRRVLEAMAEHPQALNLLGVLLYQTGRTDEGLALLQRSVDAEPRNGHAWNNLGRVHKEQHRPAAAIDCFERAARLMPQDPAVRSNLGGTLCDVGRLDEAIEVCQQAVAIAPSFAEGWRNLGTALRLKRDLRAALDALGQAIALRPEYAAAHAERGSALADDRQYDPAITAFETAIRLDPQVSQYHNNLGTVFYHVGRLEEARACYERALDLDPDVAVCHSNLIYLLNYLPEVDDETIWAESRRWAARHERPADTEPVFAAKRRFRVGYVSPDFRDHSVAHFFEALLAHHDPDVVETWCYADLHSPDSVSRRISHLAAHWRIITGEPDERVVEMIREDRIDILVDLAGHTSGNRLRVFARRPAPLQISWLGYPNTTGLDSIDFRFTDAIADPPGTGAQFYAETLFRLPDTFLCFHPPDVPLPASSQHALCFGCFNALPKINQRLVDAWAELLERVPDASLILKNHGLSSETGRQQVLGWFRARGINTSRLKCYGTVPSRADHLALYGQVDIALDTWPYNGTTTTCEALWMGVPVVTLAGDSHRSRVSASMLTSIGHAELITGSAEAYVDCAAALAGDRKRLGALKRDLRTEMRASVLTDGARFARRVEAAYASLWKERTGGPG